MPIRIQWFGYVFTNGNSGITLGLKMKIPDKRLLGDQGLNIGWHAYERLVIEGINTQEDREWWMVVVVLGGGHLKIFMLL